MAMIGILDIFSSGNSVRNYCSENNLATLSLSCVRTRTPTDITGYKDAAMKALKNEELSADAVGKKQNNTSEKRHAHQKLLIASVPVFQTRFEKPVTPTFSAKESFYSVLSLIFMSIAAVYMYNQLATSQSAWVWLPFAFTIFGSVIGWMFEFGLIMFSVPFQKNVNAFTTFVQNVRFLNLAPVTATIFFFVCAMTIPDPNVRMAMLYLSSALCFGLGTALFFGGSKAVPMILLGIQALQILIVLSNGAAIGGHDVSALLILQAILQATALIIGTNTPKSSTAFHLISTFSGIALFLAVQQSISADPTFSQQVAPSVPEGSLAMWGLVLACLSGLLLAMKWSPMTYNNWRAIASNAIWSVQYFLLVSAKRFPKPFNLAEVYANQAPQPATLKPYYQQHPEFLPQALTIPAVEKLEGNVTAFKAMLKQVKRTFSVIALMDHFFPQANVNIPLKHKPRMNVWSDGSDIYPKIFLQKLFGLTIPGPGLEPTPEPAITAFKEGQLLAYLAESGVANPMLQPVPARGEDQLKIDFTFLEQYETKFDYEPYGGIAYFRVNSDREKLELVSVVPPGTTEEIAVDPNSGSFRHAESLVLASLYFMVISGKHLAEIHMTYNLVEVAMHNAFDAQGQYSHPLRTFMYIHLFSHELAEELTTEHLVQEGAVFSQIFATTHDSLVEHLNDSYHNFQYGTDEDFEMRAKLVTMKNGNRLPNACINWELEYAEIWQSYTNSLMDIIYTDDESVVADQYVQDLYRGLNEVMVNGLPDRYEAFRTKSGLSRWASDTIHHLVIRHQVYGTTGVKAAMDPRISSTQVPKDGGTPGVDEWRSLICVALATARARFTLLVGPDGQDFTYLLNGVHEKYKTPMTEVFRKLQADLLALEKAWTQDEGDHEYNYNYFRALPSELHTGPGY